MIYNLEFRMGEEVDSMTYGGGAPVVLRGTRVIEYLSVN